MWMDLKWHKKEKSESKIVVIISDIKLEYRLLNLCIDRLMHADRLSHDFLRHIQGICNVTSSSAKP